MMATILKTEVAVKRAVQIVKGFTAVEKAITPYQDHPMMIRAQQMMEMTAAYVKVEEEQKELAKKQLELALEQSRMAVEQSKQAVEITELQAKTQAALGQTGYYTILGFSNLEEIKVPEPIAQDLGRKARKMSEACGLLVERVKDKRYGKVNAYNEDILKIVFDHYKNSLDQDEEE